MISNSKNTDDHNISNRNLISNNNIIDSHREKYDIFIKNHYVKLQNTIQLNEINDKGLKELKNRYQTNLNNK